MADLVDTFARRNLNTSPGRFTSAPSASYVSAAQGSGPGPTITSPERPGNPGAQTQPGGSGSSGSSGGSGNRVSGTTAPGTPQSNIGDYMPALADLNNQLALSRAQLDNQRGIMYGNQVAMNQGYDAKGNALRNQLGANLAEANLNIRGYDIQQQNFPQWYKFLAEQWGNEMTRGKHNLDYNGQQQVNSANQRLIEWRENQHGRRVVEQQAGTAKRDATSAATVSGVIQGAKQDFTDIENQRRNGVTDLEFADQKSRLSETQRRQQIANQRHGLIADLQGFDINTRESQAKLREREQLLGIEAQKARLKPQQLYDALNVSLANLGLDKTMSTGQFLESLGNMDAQNQALLSQFIRDQATLLGGVNYWETPGGTGGGGGSGSGSGQGRGNGSQSGGGSW